MTVVIKYIPEDSLLAIRDVETIMTDGVSDSVYIRVKGRRCYLKYPKEEFEVVEVAYE